MSHLQLVLHRPCCWSAQAKSVLNPQFSLFSSHPHRQETSKHCSHPSSYPWSRAGQSQGLGLGEEISPDCPSLWGLSCSPALSGVCLRTLGPCPSGSPAAPSPPSQASPPKGPELTVETGLRKRQRACVRAFFSTMGKVESGGFGPKK